MLVLQPDDLGPTPSGRTLDDEPVRTTERSELDTTDAGIPVAVRRAGNPNLATSDADVRHAQLEFDVDTRL